MKFSNPINLFRSDKKDGGKTNSKKIKTTKEPDDADEADRKFLGVFRIESNKELAIIGVITAIILWLAITGIGLYAFHWENQYAETMTQYVPYPVAFVNDHVIYYYQYLENVNILKKYETQFKDIYFKSAQGKQVEKSIRNQTMSSLVQYVFVKQEAAKLHLTVSQKELDESYAQLIKSNGGQTSFDNVLSKYYGLTSYQFEYDIYRDRLIQQKVMDNFASDASINQNALNLAQKVLAKLKGGADFSTLAKEYSQDTATAANGGDLGFFSKGKMDPDFEKVAFALQAGQTSGIVKTVNGYEIIKVVAINGSQIHAYHILIKTKDFQTWLNDSVKSAKKHYLISL